MAQPFTPEAYLAHGRTILAALPNDAARFAECTKQIERWNCRYEQWMALVDGGGDPGDLTAWDFSETIAALEIERGKYERVAA